jgi:hypothetical protein
MLVLPHLPFQAVYTRVAGVVSQSAADHADNGQSRKAEPELIHIELLMMRRLELLVGETSRWFARDRAEPFAHPAGNVFGGLSRAHSIIESTRSVHAGTRSAPECLRFPQSKPNLASTAYLPAPVT